MHEISRKYLLESVNKREAQKDVKLTYKTLKLVCVLSQILFNVYTKVLIQKCLWEQTEEIRGEIINNIICADDTAILCKGVENLQVLKNLAKLQDEKGAISPKSFEVWKIHFIKFN